MQRSVKIILAASIFASAIIAGLSFTSKIYRFTAQDFPRHEPNALKLQKEPEATLFFAGDVMLSRNVSSKIEEVKDVSLPFRKMADTIKAADIAFANLESPFSDKGARVTEGLVFKTEPGYINGLVESGLDVLSTANNHALDQGKYGIDYTLNLLKQNNLNAVGTGTDCHKGKVVEKNGIRVGFLAYSYAGFNDGGNRKTELVCDLKDPKSITEDVASLKISADIVVVSMHGGIEYVRLPNETQIAAAHSAIDGGADLVIGHHPHWVQNAEKYKDKWIFYSLGNFVFDQMWSKETREGLALSVKASKKSITNIDLIPVIIDDYCCARPAEDNEAEEILKKADLTRQAFLDKN
jgi:poly-gamma-glutamate synthesis protein (capsule biosynthesis protein)